MTTLATKRLVLRPPRPDDADAIGAALERCRATTGAVRVAPGAFRFNAASLAIQRKLGFVVTGCSMVRYLARGENIEPIDTELTRAAYSALMS